MTLRSLFVLAAALVLAALSACGLQPSARPEAIVDIDWKLASLQGEPIGRRQPPSLRFDSADKRISGFSGCNRFTSSYTLDGSVLRIIEGRSTRMACVQGMEAEDAFFAMLRSVRSWRIDGDTLKLLDAGGDAIAAFARGKPEAKP